MQPIAFCNRCRGMKVGWNARYVLHCLACEEWFAKSFKFLVLTALLSSFMFAFPVTTGHGSVETALVSAVSPLVSKPALSPVGKDLAAIEGLLSRNGVEKERVPRVAKAILASSSRHKLDPRLVASIVVVESRANPFAVSESNSIGIMQIHLGTWGEVVDRENVNLFKVEDNVEFGVKILRSYIVSSGLWEGVARYKGLNDEPESRQAAEEYVQKIQSLYSVGPASAGF